MRDCKYVGQLAETVPKSTQKKRKGDCAGEKERSEQTLTSAPSNYHRRAKTPPEISVSLRFLRSVSTVLPPHPQRQIFGRLVGEQLDQDSGMNADGEVGRGQPYL